MQEQMKGLFNILFKEMNIGGESIVPKLDNNILRIELGKEELKNVAFRGLKPEIKNVMDLDIVDGKVVITVRLF